MDLLFVKEQQTIDTDPITLEVRPDRDVNTSLFRLKVSKFQAFE